MRELEQCVRNVLVRGDVPAARRPATPIPAAALLDDAARRATDGRGAAGRYCALVYAQTGSYQETARRLGLDRRTVKAKVDAARRG